MARYPDSNYLYICYSYDLAVKQTQTIREIMSMPSYRTIFGVEMSDVVYSKGNFETSAGGCVYAAGTGGTITGRGAGVKYTIDRFTGAMVFDDLIKPDEASSDVVREGSIDWYYNTALSRRNNGDRTPTINIGQRVHEADLTAHLMKEDSWHSLVIPALDSYNNALDPRIHTSEQLLKMQEQEPYTFAAQYQQNPQPSGGGIFKPDWFPLLELEPNILASFITVDTAETSKTYNDATVFSLWGLYKPIAIGNIADQVALHWMECVQIRVEPKDLESEFIAFYNKCLQYNVKPSAVAIEKKSTGTTLLSLLSKYHGIQVIDIQCNATTSDGRSNSKTARFLAAQPYLAKHLVSLPRYGTHTNMCLDHVRKITANNTHRFDDICFVAGTKIATLFGYKNIETITKKDFVITPFGLRRVLSCGMSGINKSVIRYKNLIGTTGHPIFSDNEFKRLDTLTDDSCLDMLSFGGIFKWKYKKLLYLMESNINLWARKDIILANQMTIQKESMLRDCMWLFGNFIAGKQFKKAILFIIRMVIVLITTIATWNVFLISNILKCMLRNVKEFLLQSLRLTTLIVSESKQKHGIEVMKAENGIGKMLKTVSIKLRNIFAAFVKKNSKQNHVMQDTALTNAINSMKPKERENEETQDVYNLCVNGIGVYYANDILVSNCDTMAYAIDIELSRSLISKLYVKPSEAKQSSIAKDIMRQANLVSQAKNKAFGGR
jgi:hypothetical protein